MSSVAFLHVGKCGGTSINSDLKANNIKFKHYHLRRLALNRRNNRRVTKIISFVRHPVDRFVSAFEMAKNVHSFALNGIDVDQLNLSNCPAPARLRKKFKKSLPYTFSPLYDSLLDYFSDANHLAESLYSNDFNARNAARIFMNLPQEHLFKGIGWYFYNGALVRYRREELFFVGRLEHFSHDFNVLMSRLGIESHQPGASNKRTHLRKANVAKKCLLTGEGRASVIKWYESTDYSALIALEREGYLSRDDVNFYYQ